MHTLESIKKKLQARYAADPHIHINVSINKPKVRLINAPVVIKGVYPRFFLIEEQSSDLRKSHTIQYTDLLTGQVEIVELS